MQLHWFVEILRKVVAKSGHVMQLFHAPPKQVAHVISHLAHVLPPPSYHPGLHGHDLLPSSYRLSVRLQDKQLEVLEKLQVKHVYEQSGQTSDTKLS